MLCRTYQRENARRRISARRQPFGACARLARATPTLKQPCRPLTCRRKLRRMRDLRPARREHTIPGFHGGLCIRKRVQWRRRRLSQRMVRFAPFLFRCTPAQGIDAHAIMRRTRRRRSAAKIIPPHLRPHFRTMMLAHRDGAFGFFFFRHAGILWSRRGRSDSLAPILIGARRSATHARRSRALPPCTICALG